MIKIGVNDHNPASIYWFKVKKHWKKMHNMLKINNNDTRTRLIDIFLVSLLQILNIFCAFFDVSIVDFKHGFVYCEFTWTNMNYKNENCWKVTFYCQLFRCIFHLNILIKFSFCSLDISGTFFSPKLIFQNFKYPFCFFAYISCSNIISHRQNLLDFFLGSTVTFS